jgi:hypothetical protein
MPSPAPVSITASAQISSGPCYIDEIYIEGGSNAASVSLANQATSGGTRVLGLRADANDEKSRSFPRGVYFSTACYATLTGTSPRVEIAWSRAGNA